MLYKVTSWLNLHPYNIIFFSKQVMCCYPFVHNRLHPHTFPIIPFQAAIIPATSACTPFAKHALEFTTFDLPPRSTSTAPDVRAVLTSAGCAGGVDELPPLSTSPAPPFDATKKLAHPTFVCPSVPMCWFSTTTRVVHWHRPRSSSLFSLSPPTIPS